MKGISLLQPWASLVAIGAKKIETRSWSTSHRGLIAIHASKGYPKACRDLVSTHHFKKHLCGFNSLPLGAIIAVAELVKVEPTEGKLAFFQKHERCFGAPADEFIFGDYSAGRFAWNLSYIREVDPVPCKGSLGLWNVPEAIEQHLSLVI